MRNLPFGRGAAGERGRPVSYTHSRRFMVTLGAAGIAAAITMAYIGYHSPEGIPGRSYYTVKAQFKSADNLTRSYQVRIGGRLVGQVLRPRVENGLGVVDLQLKKDVKPLLSDTTLRVRPRSPVGVRFVELHPGTKGTPLPDGGTIPAANTSITVQLDEALGTLDAPRRADTQTIFRELGRGFVGRGDDINQALSTAPPTIMNLDRVAAAVNAVPNGVGRFVAGSESAAAAADPVRDDIATGFKPESQALRPFADEHEALAKDLQVAPSSLRAVQGNLARISPLLGQLDRLGHSATPTLRAAVPTLRGTRALLTEARPGLAQLPGSLGLLKNAVPPTIATLQKLDPVLPSVDHTLLASLPILGQLAPRDCDLKRFFGNWNSLLQYATPTSNVLRFSVEGSAETLQGPTKPLTGTYQSAYPAPCAPDTQKITGARR